MRIWGVLALLAVAAGSARADSASDVRALVGKYVQALGEMRPDAANALQTKDAVIVSVEGGATSDAETYRGIYGADAGEGKLSLVEARVVVDDAHHVAWFHCVVDTSWVMELMTASGPNRARDQGQLRISGIAVADHGWKIAAAMVSDVVPDTSLYKRLDADAKRPPSFEGQDTPGTAVGRWLFDGSLVAHQSKAATIVVNGTAPKEYGQSAAATALAKGWDKLGMWASPIGYKPIAGMAFVWGSVLLPVKGKGAARMVLGAIVVKEADGWRWVSLNFSPQVNW